MFPQRLGAAHIRRQAETLIRVWNDWSDYLAGLRPPGPASDERSRPAGANRTSQPAPNTDLHRCRGARARLRHRNGGGDVHRVPSRSRRTTSRSRSGTRRRALDFQGSDGRVRAGDGRSQTDRTADTDHARHRRLCALGRDARRPDGRRPVRAAQPGARDRQLLRHPWRPACARPALSQRRRRARRAARARVELRGVARRIRR